MAAERPLATAGWIGGAAVVAFAGLTTLTAIAPTTAFFASIVVVILAFGIASLLSDGLPGLVGDSKRGQVHTPDHGLMTASVEGADSVEGATRRVRLLRRVRLVAVGVAVGAASALPLAPRVVTLLG